jgi:pantoate--beta-alanine ligase
MEIFATPADMQAWSDRQRSTGRRIGFVPTMGALHDGHLALVADAARRADDVVVSIFVNPLQFNEVADFNGYPRPIDDDVTACKRAGVAAVFAPTAAAMYPDGFQTRVIPGPLGDVMEGPNRPGHFEGVVTVVAKLFGAVRPHVAVFGQKDYQQLRIITQMAADLDLGIDIIGHPIVRHADGLARSSRNVRLTAEQRAAAVAVPRSLDAAITVAATGVSVDQVMAAALNIVAGEPLASLEYVTVFDADQLTAVDNLPPVARRPGLVRIATAIWFDDVRLIDNRDLFEA